MPKIKTVDLENPADYDVMKHRDIEWAWHKQGATITSLPRVIRARNCGYTPPADPGPKHGLVDGQ